jgi:hypothetical protein
VDQVVDAAHPGADEESSLKELSPDRVLRYDAVNVRGGAAIQGVLDIASGCGETTAPEESP